MIKQLVVLCFSRKDTAIFRFIVAAVEKTFVALPGNSAEFYIFYCITDNGAVFVKAARFVRPCSRRRDNRQLREHLRAQFDAWVQPERMLGPSRAPSEEKS